MRGGAVDDGPAGPEVNAHTRRGAVALVVAQHQLQVAPLDRVPLAGVEHRLEFVEARGGGRAAAIAEPGQPATAADPPAEAVHHGQRGQADHQAGEGQEENERHVRCNARQAR
jgi:hypothetical protein